MKFLNGSIRHHCMNLEMTIVFLDALEMKHKYDTNTIPSNIRQKFEYLYVIGQSESDELHLDRYSVTKKSWENVMAFESKSDAYIQTINNDIYVITTIPKLKESKVNMDFVSILSIYTNVILFSLHPR